MIYNLGKYRYKNCKIYKRVWWFIYKCIDTNPIGFKEAVRRINALCGIEEEVVEVQDYSMYEAVTPTNTLDGKFLVNFKKPEYSAGNDPLVATISPYSGILEVVWENGYFAQCDCSAFNIFKYEAPNK